MIDYLEERIPEKLSIQIEKAIGRGDMVAIPRTVQIEFNAALKKEADKKYQSLKQAYDLLIANGFTMSHEPPGEASYVDVWAIIKRQFNQVHLLEPKDSDYLEAEKRASCRLPPFPKNKPESEEMRDRVIWCQLLSLSKEIDVPIYLVSEDKIFENGAKLEEGLNANILILKGEDELNQHLESAPPHIKELIDNILSFVPQLADQGLRITSDEITMVSDVRKMNISFDQKESRFTLSLKQDEQVTTWDGQLRYYSGEPQSLRLVSDSKTYTVESPDMLHKKIDAENQHTGLSAKERDLIELRRSIGG